MVNNKGQGLQGNYGPLTSSIVSAYVARHFTPVSELGKLISDIHSALQATSSSIVPAAAKQRPAVSIRKSVHDDHLTCLECGVDFKSLKRHLMTHHAQSPQEYREKWHLQSDYPMVAPSYAEVRSRLAKDVGLGQSRRRSRGA
ncbi:transcriptional regulator [Neorhizobium sp. P12A]|jgi:predicted transcriptional regulator|uniref:MucR family transcriptional regulator n=1 Tax=Neorhizobium sp. P12A TaxID=2268027 RepID=UPI0011EF4C49|nr:MucR family transcriptional regulator [Neorhizobium sp. P12A]KAA0683869.1 transcriptional regulator [Neorhizobium sp. P12A]